MLIHNADITGSLLVNGIPYNTGSFSGSFTGIVAGTTATASYVEYNSVANKPALVSGSSQITYSGLTGIPSGIVSGSAQVTYSGLTGVPSGIVSGSAQISEFGIFATTGSNQFNGNQSITGSLTVSGQVVAQTLNVQQVTSSIVYSSGSNIFGNSLSNTQQFTGSVGVTGSLTVAGNINLNGASNFPTTGLLNRTSDSTLYLVSAATGFVLTDSSLNTMYNVTPTAHNWNISNSLKMKLDSSGNLGLGVTPSNFYAGSVSFEIGANGILWSEQASSIYNSMSIGSNFYYNSAGSLLYKNTGVASSRYIQFQGSHFWSTAPSGTAGNAISFTQAMTLTSGGNLLVGTTSDNGARLQVSGTSSLNGDIYYYNAGNINAIITSGAAANGRMYLYASATADIGFQAGGNSWFLNNLGIGTTSLQATYKVTISGTDTIFPAIYLENTTNSQAYSIRATGTNFVVRDNTSGNDRFTIASTGAATFSSSVTATQFNSTSSNASLPGFGVSSGNGMYNAGTNILAFSTTSTERMRITSAGYVGIGTSEPQGILSVSSTIAKTNTTFTRLASFKSSEAYASYPLELSIAQRGNATSSLQSIELQAGHYGLDFNANLVFQKDGGNVGIGTSTPQSQLHLSSTAPIMSFTDTNSFTDPLDRFIIRAGANQGNIQWYDDSSATTLSIMTFLSSGNVGIGTTSPSALLHLEKASQDNVLAVVGQSGYEGALFLSGAGSGKDANIVVGNDRSLIFYSTANSTPAARGTKFLTIDTQGIKFGTDTAAANALDDYEEGTWTPTIEGEDSNPTLTYSTRLGYYTKVGRVVTIHCALQPNSTTSAGTGILRFGGLPFTSANLADCVGNGVASSNGNFNWGTNKTQLNFSVGVNTTKIRVWAMQNGTTEAGVPVNNFNNSNQYLLFSLTYIAT